MNMLTDEQRELISKNHNMIYDFIYKNKLDINNYYDIVAIGLCKAAMKYDLSKGEFSTFAYKCMNSELKNHFIHINAKRRVPENEVISYDITINSNDDEFIIDRLLNNDNDMFDSIVVSMDYLSFIKRLDEREQTILKYLQSGLRQYQIAEKINLTQQYVSTIINNIKKKWNKYYNN